MNQSMENGGTYQVPQKKKSTARELRQRARADLKGNWGYGVLGFLAFFIPAIAMQLVMGVFLLLGLFLEAISPMLREGPWPALFIAAGSLAAIIVALLSVSALSVGHCRLSLSFHSTEKKGPAGLLFSGFKRGFGVSVRTFCLMALKLLPGVIFALAVVISSVAYLSSFPEGTTPPAEVSLIISFGIAAAMVLYLIYCIYITMKYAMCFYIVADEPTMKARDVLYSSAEMMRGNKGRLFCLGLSFIGWSILSAFTCGIGQLFLIPYIKQSMTAFYCEISGKDQAEEVEFPSIDPEDYFTAS